MPARPSVLVMHATGSNRDREAALACRRAGGDPRIVHLHALLSGAESLLDHAMLVIPGGFSYGDDLGAGKLWATLLRVRLGADLHRFVADGRPVIGICNGFQVLVKAGLLPGPEAGGRSAFGPRTASLTRNRSGRFQCRWVWLEPNPASPCVFTRHLRDRIHCPVAHGEGRFVVRDQPTFERLEARGAVALRYVRPDGSPAGGYPFNPNGSIADIAGITNAAGNVLGLMPHPEDHVSQLQRPDRECGGAQGLSLFAAGVYHAAHG